MLIMEAIGRGLVLEPYFASVVLGGNFLLSGGSEAQKRELLPKLAEGALMLAFGYTERQSRYDLHDVAFAAKKDGGGYVLSGHKGVVLNAASADKIVVSARTVDGLRASELHFDNVKVGADAVIGDVDNGLPLIEKIADHAIAALAAEAVGCMSVLVDVTNEYLKTRKQFGVPLSKFQVLQHRMVDCFMETEQARSMAYMVTLKLEGTTEAERRKAAAGAKVQIGKGGRFVGQQSVQLHGGMGMTDELSVGHYFKRLTMINTMFGDADYHLKRFAEF
jgi:alkylation response protein AidB-like acyl-CoA dehydrogenase